MPFHGDRVFAVVLSNGEDAWYFANDPLAPELSPILRKLFSEPDRTWEGHNIRFDLHSIFATFGAEIAGDVYDTMTGARLEYNDHITYGLDACAERIGLKKSNAVEEYISEHALWEWQTIPGKKVRRKNKFFHKVPREIMVPYACQDALVAYKLARHQRESIGKIDALLPEAPRLADVLHQEAKILKVVTKIERKGLKVDVPYCERAIEFYRGEASRYEKNFNSETGEAYKASSKLFEKIFGDEREKWAFTEKGNPSFESDVLQGFSHPAAKSVLGLRNAKSRLDFFSGFLFYADREGFVHPSLNPAGTATGRFSSSEPNFQNLTNDEENAQEQFPTRRAIIPPSSEHLIFSFDYKQQEYALMLDYAGELEIIEQVKNGADVHQATADLMGVSRKYAKTLNFMLLYGGGALKLADALGLSESEAKALKALYFAKLPKVEAFINRVISVGRTRGYVYNWCGRRYFCEREFAYKMPNRVIQGGGADIIKRAMVRCDQYLEGKTSRLALTVHDEADFYVSRRDNIEQTVLEIKKIMCEAYPARYLPLTVDVQFSAKSLGDLEEWSYDKTA